MTDNTKLPEIGWRRDVMEPSTENSSALVPFRSSRSPKRKSNSKQSGSSLDSSRSSSSSSASSSNNDEHRENRKRLKKEKREKKHEEKKLKKAAKRLEKDERKKLKKVKKDLYKEEKRLKKLHKKSSKKAKKDEADCAIPIDLMFTKAQAPETPEEYKARQSQIRREKDPLTGRTRLIKGDGEVLEEIVSRNRHKDINKQATRGDGEFFQSNAIDLNFK